MVQLGQAPVISVIIVSFNTAAITLNCLRAVFEQDVHVPFEVIVVDNGSQDDSVRRIREDFPAAAVLPLSENVGFGRANNLGLAHSRGRYVLFLNSDTVPGHECFRICLEYLEQQPQVGMVGCKVLLPDGRFDYACRRGFPTPGNALAYFSGLGALFPRSRWLNGYSLSYLDPDQKAAVDCISGAFIFARRDVLEQVNGFDPDYFFYAEDIDLCFRVREAGWEVHYLPHAYMLHLRGASTPADERAREWYFESMWSYYKKHLRVRYHPLVTALVRLGIWASLTWVRLSSRFRRRHLTR